MADPLANPSPASFRLHLGRHKDKSEHLETINGKKRRKRPLFEILSRTLQELKRRDDYQFFDEPVNAQLVPDYYRVIQNPMFLSTMESKIEDQVYRTFEQFSQDWERLVENAKLFNPPSSKIHKEIVKLNKWALSRFPLEALLVLPPDEDQDLIEAVENQGADGRSLSSGSSISDSGSDGESDLASTTSRRKRSSLSPSVSEASFYSRATSQVPSQRSAKARHQLASGLFPVKQDQGRGSGRRSIPGRPLGSRKKPRKGEPYAYLADGSIDPTSVDNPKDFFSRPPGTQRIVSTIATPLRQIQEEFSTTAYPLAQHYSHFRWNREVENEVRAVELAEKDCAKGDTMAWLNLKRQGYPQELTGASHDWKVRERWAFGSREEFVWQAGPFVPGRDGSRLATMKEWSEGLKSAVDLGQVKIDADTGAIKNLPIPGYPSDLVIERAGLADLHHLTYGGSQSIGYLYNWSLEQFLLGAEVFEGQARGCLRREVKSRLDAISMGSMRVLTDISDALLDEGDPHTPLQDLVLKIRTLLPRTAAALAQIRHYTTPLVSKLDLEGLITSDVGSLGRVDPTPLQKDGLGLAPAIRETAESIQAMASLDRSSSDFPARLEALRISLIALAKNVPLADVAMLSDELVNSPQCNAHRTLLKQINRGIRAHASKQQTA